MSWPTCRHCGQCLPPSAFEVVRDGKLVQLADCANCVAEMNKAAHRERRRREAR